MPEHEIKPELGSQPAAFAETQDAIDLSTETQISSTEFKFNVDPEVTHKLDLNFEEAVMFYTRLQMELVQQLQITNELVAVYGPDKWVDHVTDELAEASKMCYYLNVKMENLFMDGFKVSPERVKGMILQAQADYKDKLLKESSRIVTPDEMKVKLNGVS